MFSSEFVKKCFRRPTSIVDGIKSNVVDNLKPSSLMDTVKSYVPGFAPSITDKVKDIAEAGLDELSSIPNAITSTIPDAVSSVIPDLSSLSPNALLSSIPNAVSSVIPDLSSLSPRALLSSIPKAAFSLIPDSLNPFTLLASLPGVILSMAGSILSFLPSFPLLSTITGFLLSLSSPMALLTASPVLMIVIPFLPFWYFFFNDRNIILACYERFGRGVGRFSGKVVWLVGATTSLSEAMALELAASGAKLILSARREDMLERIKKDCIEKSKGKLYNTDVMILPFDVTEMDEKYVEKAISFFGKIDVFINNVGHIELGESCKLGIASDRAAFDVNFFGPVFLAKHVMTHFKEKGEGQMIIMSSLCGKFGIPGQAAASASKHALHGYFDSLRHECKGHKIYVTIVCPGLMRTSITDHSVLAGTSKISSAEMAKISKKGLKTKRCAHLALVAGANRTFEAWISNQPFLFLVAMEQYFPGINKYIMRFIFSDKRVEKIYEGRAPGICSWKPLFVI